MVDPGEHVFRLVWEIEGARHSHVLRPGETLLGSSAECALRLRSPVVSRRHAVLRWVDGQVTIEDLGSKNGLRVTGRQVRTCILQTGDIVEIGPIALQLQSIDPDDAELALPPAPPHPPPPRPASASRGRTPTASSADQGSSVRALDTIRQALTSLASRPSDLGCVLEIVHQTLGLEGCALLRVAAGKQPEVLARRGGMAALLSLDGILAELTRTRHAKDALESPHGTHLGIRRVAGGSTWVLATWAEAIDRAAVGPVVESVLDAMLIAQTQRPDSPGQPRASSGRGLRFPPNHVPGRSAGMRSLYSQIARLANGALPILITGETGVGKEHVAQILHLSSPRHEGPFHAVNCAAIPAELLESELFGIERGVATGVSQRAGKMLLANGGVLLLDEIGDMPLSLQPKLLRAIQEREVLAIGGRHAVPIDVWVLAATNADPAQLLESGRLRRDLYYRLAGCTLHVPPLRQRRDDLAPLTEHVLKLVANETGRPSPGVTVKALRALAEAPWPGNVRQLEHEVRRLALLCPEGQPIDSSLLSLEVLAPAPPLTTARLNGDLDLRSQVDALERTLITAALARTRGNQSKAAELLGISRDGLRLKLQKVQSPARSTEGT